VDGQFPVGDETLPGIKARHWTSGCLAACPSEIVFYFIAKSVKKSHHDEYLVSLQDADAVGCDRDADNASLDSNYLSPPCCWKFSIFHVPPIFIFG